MASAPPWHCLSHATWAACVAHHCLPFSLPPFFCPSTRPTFPVCQRADVRRRPHLAGPRSPSPPPPFPPVAVRGSGGLGLTLSEKQQHAISAWREASFDGPGSPLVLGLGGKEKALRSWDVGRHDS